MEIPHHIDKKNYEYEHKIAYRVIGKFITTRYKFKVFICI